MRLNKKITTASLALSLMSTSALSQTSSEPVVTVFLAVSQEWMDQQSIAAPFETTESYINTALRNSGVNGTVQFQGGYVIPHNGDGLVPGQFYNYLNTTANPEGVEFRNNIANSTADIFVILFAGPYCAASASGNHATISSDSLCNNNLAPSWPVSDPYLVRVFAHEVGHLLGAHHGENASVLPPEVAPPYARAYCLPNGLSTLMENNCSGGYIPHYSNPNVYYQGYPTGTANANNALAISSNIATVAAYKSHTNVTATAFVTPNSVVSSGTTVTLRWSSTNATHCTFNGITYPAHGSHTYTAYSDAQYAIVCHGPGGTSSIAQTFVDVQ